MSVVRPDVRRLCALLFVIGAVGFGSVRPARAELVFRFSQEFSLEDADLSSIDAFGAFWSFKGTLFLDTTLVFDDFGNCFVRVTGFTDSKGFNYRLGTSARLSIFFDRFADCQFDPVDGTLRAKVPFWLNLLGEGGGALPAEMHLALFQEGAAITGIDIGCDPFSF
jgi:hypothetical protein